MAPQKILITTSPKASKMTYEFCDELVGVIPGSEFIRRKKGKGFEVGRIAGWAAGRGYNGMWVINEDMKKPSACIEVLNWIEADVLVVDAITMIHLPEGPTAYFKLTSIELTKQIFVRPSRPSSFITLLSNNCRATQEQPHTTPS